MLTKRQFIVIIVKVICQMAGTVISRIFMSKLKSKNQRIKFEMERKFGMKIKLELEICYER